MPRSLPARPSLGEPAPADPFDALAAAVRQNDVAAATRVLAQHPEFRPKLNDAMPGGAFGETVLSPAVRSENREMIDLLLRSGADIDARSHWWAGSFGVLDTADPGFVPFLLERGATMTIHAASRLGMRAVVQEMVGAHPKLVHARGGDGQTPLHFAATVDIAKTLLDHGADIDALDVDHESTPAQYMIRDRQPVARFLVERGCRTDLLMASALGDVALVRRHLDSDPSLISMSVSERYFPKIDPRAGGTIYNWTLGGNKTAHLVAREFGHEGVYEYLMARTPDVLKLAVACELGDEAAVGALLGAHPNLTGSMTSEERRRVAIAAERNNTEAVRLMLAAGWPPDGGGQSGASPLHWAGFHGNAEMAGEILRYRPPLELEDGTFHTSPLRWALFGSVHGWHKDRGDYAATVELLLDAGAAMPPFEGLEASDAVRDVLRRRGITA